MAARIAVAVSIEKKFQQSFAWGSFYHRISFFRACKLRIITSMYKPFLNVAALLLFVALMIPAQAPDGAPPAGKAPTGPDAVAANLVNTVCASCHSLDRVKNKTADNAGWTTTVTRMKEKGANLTDEQVPVVVEYPDQGCQHSHRRACRWRKGWRQRRRARPGDAILGGRRCSR